MDFTLLTSINRQSHQGRFISLDFPPKICRSEYGDPREALRTAIDRLWLLYSTDLPLRPEDILDLTAGDRKRCENLLQRPELSARLR